MRRGLRFALPLLAAAVLVELVVFVGVGRAVGFGVALLLVVAVSLVGVVLLHREGMRTWRGFRVAAASGQPPGPRVTDGLVGLVGALLLAVPGLVSGVVGALLLVPPVRAAARSVLRRGTQRWVSSMLAGDLLGPRRVRVRRGPAVADGDQAIEGEIVESGR